MTRRARMPAIAVLLIGLVGVTGARSGAIGDAPPEQITTDTLAYCRELALRLEQLTGKALVIPASVSSLSSAGRRMCEQGLTRGGILRLRKAIVLMMHPKDQAGGDPGAE